MTHVDEQVRLGDTGARRGRPGGGAGTAGEWPDGGAVACRADWSTPLPGLFASLDADGRYRAASASHREWLGVPPGEAVGRHYREVLGGRLAAVHQPYVAAALSGRDQVQERTARDDVGRERHFEITYVPDRDADGEVRGAFVQAIDVTARVRAQANLAEAQEMAGLGSWGWELEVGFTASVQTARILGHDPHRWSPTPEAAVDAVHPEDLPWVVHLLRESLASGETWDARHRVVRPDGEVRHVHSRARVELGADGVLLRVAGTILDVTAEMRLAEEVGCHNRRLADTMAMLGHDVRQPLTAVLGYLEEAGRVTRPEDGDVDPATTVETMRACVDRAGRAGARMRRLLENILAVASVDSGTLVARPERVALAGLLEAILDEVGVPATVTGAEEVVVRADLFHLRQAVTNLLVNATKYGDPPFGISVRDGGDTVELTVEDHGAGVPEEFVPRLFGRFSRGTTRAHGSLASTGLGLHLVRSLVEANEGSVRYEGRAGRGARFVVSLPAA